MTNSTYENDWTREDVDPDLIDATPADDADDIDPPTRYPKVPLPAVNTRPASTYRGDFPWTGDAKPKPAPPWVYGEGAEPQGTIEQPPLGKWKYKERRPKHEIDRMADRVMADLEGTAPQAALEAVETRLRVGNLKPENAAAYLAKIVEFQATQEWKVWTVIPAPIDAVQKADVGNGRNVIDHKAGRKRVTAGRGSRD